MVEEGKPRRINLEHRHRGNENSNHPGALFSLHRGKQSKTKVEQNNIFILESGATRNL